MELLHLGLKEHLRLRGRCTLTAYPRGLLPWLLEMGMSLADAREWAEPWVAHRSVVENLVVTCGKELVCRMLIDESGYDTGLTYHAIGTSSTTPLLADTTLGTEAARKAITDKDRAANVITLATFFTAAECTYAIEECGIFGHSTAGASADSGVLFSHWLQAYDNSGGEHDLTFDYVLTVG